MQHCAQPNFHPGGHRERESSIFHFTRSHSHLNQKGERSAFEMCVIVFHVWFSHLCATPSEGSGPYT